MNRVQTFTKVDLTPKRHHGYLVLLFVLGTLLPPLAVAARFGIGKDFWLNLLLTICGYIPGHGHNFYIQNIRNNKNHKRTPKWAQKWGLIDTSEIKRKERKSQWAGRYNDRLPQSTLENQPYEEGQEVGSSIDLHSEGHGVAERQRQNGAGGDLWNPDDERFYGQNNDSSSTRGTGGRWRYPANFGDAIEEPARKKSGKKKKEKKDRWARTEDAYTLGETGEGVSKRKKSKKKRRSVAGDSDTHSTEFPEDAEGGLYGERPRIADEPLKNGQQDGDDIFAHEL